MGQEGLIRIKQKWPNIFLNDCSAVPAVILKEPL